MQNELKNCPFCGGEAVLIDRRPRYDDYRIYCVRVPSCDTFKDGEDKKFLINFWNTRHDALPSPTPERLEAGEPDAGMVEALKAIAEARSPDGNQERFATASEMRDYASTALIRLKRKAAIASLTPSPKPVAVDAAVVTPAEGEVRFFIDHGMIHDRLTGRHVTTDETEYALGSDLRPDPSQRIFGQTDIVDCCKLLNKLSALSPTARPVELSGEEREGIAAKHIKALVSIIKEKLPSLGFNNPLNPFPVDPGNAKWAEAIAHQIADAVCAELEKNAAMSPPPPQPELTREERESVIAQIAKAIADIPVGKSKSRPDITSHLGLATATLMAKAAVDELKKQFILVRRS